MELDYKKDILIDPDNLDLECLNQPNLYMQYAELQAEARKEYDLAKRELDRATASLGNEVRKNPEHYGVSKVTNDAILSVIATDKYVETAQQRVIQARYEQELLSYVLSALDQRKRSLNNLVVLHGQQYFAGPENIRPLTREFIKQSVEEKAQNIVKRAVRKKKDD